MRFIQIFLFMLSLGLQSVLNVDAQTYNNSWIHYDQNYYKFKIAQNGLYRISFSVLQNAGLATSNLSQLQLWRNGIQEPFFVNTTGSYIEFYGRRNDGIPDKQLYKYAHNQVNDYYSLESDTVSYFLTIANGTQQINQISNEVNSQSNVANAGVLTNYFMDTAQIANPRDQINLGKATTLYGDYVYSSTYDLGEGLTSGFITSGNAYSASASNLFPYLGSEAPSARLYTGIIGCSSLGTNRVIALSANNQQLAQQTVNGFNTAVISSDVSITQIQSTLNVNASIASNNTSDRMVVSYIRLSYPRQFDFTGSSSYVFSLAANTSGNSIEINNLQGASSNSILYDLTNSKRYAAVYENGKLKFYLPASLLNRKCVIFNNEASSTTAISGLTKRTFVDYSQSDKQGDYLIISHKSLMAGANPVAGIQAYRNSEIGGKHNAKIYDIDELEDQFGFGIHNNPMSVKNFLLFAGNTYSKAPEYTFLIGRGVEYTDYYYNQSQAEMSKINFIPTFGWPASDELLSSPNFDPIIRTKIGRIPAITPDEVSIYLSKLKEYESAQASPSQSLEDKLWMKNALHVSGASTSSEESTFTNNLSNYENYLKNPKFGYTIYNFNKTTTGSLALITDQLLIDLFHQGFTVLNYFGHASSEGLNYNLNDPSNYDNKGKYPIFYISGCDVGGFFSYSDTRSSILSNIPEKYTFIQDKGTIAFLCQTGLGVPSFLNQYNVGFWNAASNANYGKSITENMINAATAMTSNPRSDSIAAYGQAEECVYLGDPAIKFNTYDKPDYAIETASVIISPSLISVSDPSFHYKAVLYNLGKAVTDSVSLTLKRQYPSGSSEIVKFLKIKPIYYKDSVEFDLPIISTRDKGQSILTLTIDPENTIDEITKSNNIVSKTVSIFDNGLNPIYPFDYGIVRDRNVKLVASTSNPLADKANYIIEIDTTDLFNSNLKERKELSTTGGIIEYKPNLTFKDSVVYYWRVGAYESNGIDLIWNTSSFQYIQATGSFGYNQSHVNQFDNDIISGMILDSTKMAWKYADVGNLLNINHGVFPNAGYQSDFAIAINGNVLQTYRCLHQNIAFNILDPYTLKMYYNQAEPSTTFSGTVGAGFMGSNNPCVTFLGYQVYCNFEFALQNASERQMASNFMDWIPQGAYVIVRLFYQDDQTGNNPNATVWAQDPLVNNKNLYTQLVNAGFSNLLDYNKPRSFVFIYKKGDSKFTPFIQLSNDVYDKIIANIPIFSPDSIGYIISPKLGPSKKWSNVVINGTSQELVSTDRLGMDIYGYDVNNNMALVKTINTVSANNSITDIDASKYPYLQLKLRNADSIHFTPYQLRYWKVLGDAVPEGALAANLHFESSDSIELGQPYHLSIAFKNVSNTQFDDSIPVHYTIYDKNNNPYVLPTIKIKPLLAGDTANINISIPSDTTGNKIIGTKLLEGLNNQYLDVNPLPGLPEYTHDNNFLYKNLSVSELPSNMTLDVTFDGVHILNNDIVAAKPNIRMTLQDISSYLLLTDTSMVSIQLRYPDQSLKRFYFNTDTVRFTPATSSKENKALVDFNPYLLADGTYELIVQAKNNLNGNNSYALNYTVPFQVINKPMISDVFNYPNPFTSSTSFVFTITGSQVPQNIRIQIMTITGKIVKDIDKETLGALHIGRNITEYKWDGTDNYGQQLGNGVYLYRVITNNNNQKLDRYNLTDDEGNGVNTSKYFKSGYGKMYLMR